MAKHKTDQQHVEECWNEFGKLFRYASLDPKPGQVVRDGVLTPAVLARELQRRTGRAGWLVQFNCVTQKFEVTPPLVVRDIGIKLRQVLQ